MRVLQLLLLLLAAEGSSAETKIHSTLLSVQKEKGQVILQAQPPPDHHFSNNAPHELAVEGFRNKILPTHVSNLEVRFLVNETAEGTQPPPGNSANKRPFDITLYLCNNAKTYCQKRTIHGFLDFNKKNLKIILNSD